MKIRFPPYDWLLERQVRSQELPDHVVLVITETDLLGNGFEVLDDFFSWCRELEIPRVNVYISLLESDGGLTEHLHRGLEELDSDITVRDQTGNPDTENGSGYVVSIGYGGRTEFVHALHELGKEVKEERINAGDIKEGDIEKHLVFDGEPDIILKTGGEHLSDFMIWQSVYSELYFADYNWNKFRKRDFLRAIRDYQGRMRRYGR